MAPADPTARALLVRGALADDPWIEIDDEAPVPAEGDVRISVARLLASDPTDFAARTGRLGVALVPSTDVRALGAWTDTLQLVTIPFPKFGDGRGYSQARILRDELGYRGELRATGDVLRDQAYLLARCGFDAFQLAPGLAPASFLAGLGDFSAWYQAAADEQKPLYRRATRPSAPR
jgi:uncharacterized protein (DUF934 family)